MEFGDLTIDGDGRPGQNGSHGYSYVGHHLASGSNGLDGGHATVPTGGDDAQTVHISLVRPEIFPEEADPRSCFHVTVDKHRYKCTNPEPHSPEITSWDQNLDSDGIIILSSRGGDGGYGGSGGNGQGGGHGVHGISATRYSRGTDGQAGGNGGNAGHGSSGANGGSAGELTIMVKEPDMDLLLALNPLLVQGGRGGNAGVNGVPGAGGNGGAGGASYTWTETYYQNEQWHTRSHTNPGGRNGVAGRPGLASVARPQPGRDGPNGAVHIFIQKANGKLDGPFPSVYWLEVVDFDIIDGNNDGILEFGEEITLQNIRVCNKGGAPAPSFSQVAVQGLSTNWLVAPNTALLLRKGLLNGSTATLDGELVFKVNRPGRFPANSPFTVNDGFELRGHLSGIERTLPNFHSPQNIVLQHPIKMTNLRHLKCLTAGHEAILMWKVENLSTKELGSKSPSGRKIGIMFRETSSESTGKTVPSDRDLSQDPPEIPINSLGPGASTGVQVVLKIKPDAIPYTRQQVHLSLLFSPPGLIKPESCQEYEIPVQIANTYRYDKEAQVLLITNYNTAADDVESWGALCDHLQLKMDIWNVSVNGHLELTGKSGAINGETKLFDLYRGKTIVMLGNSFPYFERGHRTVTDLIDHKDLAPSALTGTNIFISGTTLDDPGIKNLARHLRASTSPVSREFTTVKQLVKAIVAAHRDAKFCHTKFVCLPKPRGQHARRCADKASRIEKELSRRLPNIRFIISWSSAGATKDRAGEIEVVPGIPYSTAKFVVTPRATSPTPEDTIAFGLLLLLPFSTRLRKLWDQARSMDRDGAVSLQRLADSIAYELILELARFIHSNPPWPDCFDKQSVFTHHKRLNAFFQYAPTSSFSPGSIASIIQILGNLSFLARCCPGVWPLGLTFSTRRKNLRSVLDESISKFLADHYGPNVSVASSHLKQYLKKLASELKSGDSNSRKEKLVQSVVGKVPIDVSRKFGASPALIDLEMMGNISRKEGEAVTWKQMDLGLQMKQDLAHAKIEYDELSRSPPL